MYNPDEDEDIGDFDYSDAYVDNNNNVYNKHNPLNPEQQIVIHDCCYALMTNRITDPAKTRNLPCFEAAKGRCKEGDLCKYTHDNNLLLLT